MKKIGRQANPKKKELLGKSERLCFFSCFSNIGIGRRFFAHQSQLILNWVNLLDKHVVDKTRF